MVRFQHHISLDDLGAQGVGLADHTDGGNGRVGHQAILDLGGADAVTGRGDHVILTPHKAQIARLPDAAIPGHQPVAVKLLGGGVGAVPVFQHHGPGTTAHRHIAFLTGGLAVCVDHLDHMPRHRFPDAAGAHGEVRATGGHRHIAFGLAVEFVDGDAQVTLAPSEHLRAQGLSAGGHRAQGPKPLPRRFQHAQGGGGKEDIADLAQADHLGAGVWRELIQPRGHHRYAQRKARHGDVKQPADPRPVCGRPETIAGLAQMVVTDRHAR